MGMFEELNNEVESDIEEAKDIVGGEFAKVDCTNLYDFTITKAFAGKSSGGAFNVTLHLEAPNKARLITTEYITSGDSKGCKNYYLDKKSNKQYLPGYNKIKNLDALLGFNRAYPRTEEKKIMLYDFDAKAELPMEKEVITEWIGKQVSALIKKKLEDKYNNETESREIYEIEHFLDFKTKKTRNEIVSGEAGFKEKWLAKFGTDYVNDKRKLSKNSSSSSEQSVSTNTAEPEVPWS